MQEAIRRKIIELFERVQGVPYYLLRDRDSEKLFFLNKGCCAEKIIWLGNRLKELGIPVKYYKIKFLWEDLPIPEEILKLRKRGPGYHLSLKAKINNRWIWVDPTWDSALGKIGFPITKNWDGKSDTLLAVNPLEIEEYEPKDPSKTGLSEAFIQKLNEYFQSVRKDWGSLGAGLRKTRK